ncbi:MAG: alpha-galactosidase [Myxococcota bacterium]
MPSRSAVARHEAAGRLEAVRLGARWALDAHPERGEDGRPGGLAFGEGPLVAGTQRIGPVELQVAIDAEGDAASFDVSVTNFADVPLHLESIVLGFRWTGIPTGALRFLRHGWQSWSFTGSRDLDTQGEPVFPSGPWLRGLHHGIGAPAPDRAGWHESDLLSVAGLSEGGAACAVGVLERGAATGLVYLLREAESVRIEAEVCFEVPLEPGETRAAERVRVSLGSDAGRLLEELSEVHGRLAEARIASPFQAGWCTWYHFFHDVTEDDLLRNLDALSAARGELPIDVVQLDDGYQREIGDWLETNPKFPRGLAPVAGAIRDAGFRPGLWTAPFCVVPESRVFAEHPEWLLRHERGFHRGLIHPEWTPSLWVHVLDTSRDDVCAHLARTFAALVGLGFTYQKLDFLYAAGMQAEAADRALTRAARLRRGFDAIRTGAGDETFLLGCGCPLGPAVGVFDGMRIGPDVAPHWGWKTDGAVPGIEETRPNTRGAVRNTITRAFMHRRLWLNDPDCVMARTSDTELSEDEVDTLAVAVAATGGMTIFSDDVPVLSAADRARVGGALSLAREVDAAGTRGTARAWGLLRSEIPEGVSAWTPEGAVVALVNGSEGAREVRFPLAEVRSNVTGPGAEPSLGLVRPKLEGETAVAALAPHQTALARLRGELWLGVFCDFDGTFAVQDVGSTLAKRYAGERRAPLWERLSRGELGAWEYNMELLDGLPLPEETLDAFLRTVELDPGASDLVAWCEERGVPFRVLSDGFDRNLDRLQDLTGVRFAYDSNRLWYERGHWRIAAGHPDASCTCGTGVCKRARIEAFRVQHPGAQLVHIGNGRVSDVCGALAADVVFAKDTLAEELETRGVAFHRFETLHEVIAVLERLQPQ